jgi:hypothetical protein
MKKFIKTAGLAVAMAAMAVSTANATTGAAMLKSASPVGVASNIAAEAGNTGANLGSHVFTAAAGATVSCSTATFHLTTPVPTNSVTFRPTYSGCAFSVSGTTLGAATVDINCEWTLTFSSASFTDTTGAGTGGRADVPCSTTVTVPTIGCTIHVSPVAAAPGISSQNVTSAGVNDATATPWGSKIIANVTGLGYTTTTAAGGNCVIASSGSSATYAGSVYQRNVWGAL